MKRVIVIVAAMLSLSACTGYSLQELRKTQPSGSEFNQLLTYRYLDFAEQEAKRYDWVDSARFADKGLLAAYDNEVGPEETAHYLLTAEMRLELDKARSDLLAALTDKNRKERPAVAADALFYFDCWLEQAEESWQTGDIVYCREQFKERIAELNDTSYEELLIEQGEMEAAVDTTSYIVFFEWGQTTVNAAGAEIIDGVAKTLESEEGYEVVLNGHTDTAGDAKYNLQLSKRRADAVQERLVAKGVKAEAIQVFAFGETYPKIETEDGVKEPANRRVEIFLGE
ncbi:MAG: OmpA family protein [Rickettsiales bacterium]